MKIAYTYTILRYVHDTSAGESLNVGVVLLAPQARYLGASLQPNFGRLRKAFPNLDGDAHRELMRYLQARFDKMQDELANELAFAPAPLDAAAAAASVLPKDDSSLQWSPLGSGLSENPAAELNRLYLRYVTANDAPRADLRRNDELIWSLYRAPLAQARVLRHLSPHKVVTAHDEIEFGHAWKNQQWHCLEPFSLDYLDAESIKGKAHRLLGQMLGVQTAMRNHVLYLMVGEPQLEKCKSAGEKALSLLADRLPVKHEIIREAAAEEFSQGFAQKIEEHLLEHQST